MLITPFDYANFGGLGVLKDMIQKTRKGNYYCLKAKKWLEKDGYLVVKSEYRYRVVTPKGAFYVTKDIFSADLIAVNDKEMIFIQVKSRKSDVLKGIKDMLKIPWPKNCKCLKRWVLLWEPRAKEPHIVVVETAKDKWLDRPYSKPVKITNTFNEAKKSLQEVEKGILSVKNLETVQRIISKKLCQKKNQNQN